VGSEMCIRDRKFDASGKFIRKYVPELGRCEDKEIHAPWLIPPLKLQAINIEIGKDYPPPVVDHSNQREQALALYKNASNAAKLKAETVDNLGELS
jgi:deoxyribodipyrimidine photo-lyase